MLKDLPEVDVRLSAAEFERTREPWTLRITFPQATSGGTYEGTAEDRVQRGMHCPSFVVELSGSVDSTPEDAEVEAFGLVLELAQDVADTIWTAQQTQGFAGSTPKIIRRELEVDGSSVSFDRALRHAGGAIYIGLPLPMYDDVRQAAENAVRPSVARVLLAQATRWGLAEHFASKSAALLLAATSCEISIKSVVSQDPYGRLGTLPGVLDPQGRQAPLSPAALLERAVPLALGRSIEEDTPGIIKRYKALTRTRDSIVHTGEQIDKETLQPHLNTVRALLDWIESQLADIPASAS